MSRVRSPYWPFFLNPVVSSKRNFLVRCTAVSQDGLITTVELTGQGHLQNFGALKQVEKPVDSRIVSTAFSPHSTTLCVGFKKSTIVHKVCDKGVAVINWFPIMDDSEFEPELAKVITSVSFKEEMLPSIVDFVLPMKRINSTFYEIQRCLQNSNMDTLSYFLNKTLLSVSFSQYFSIKTMPRMNPEKWSLEMGPFLAPIALFAISSTK